MFGVLSHKAGGGKSVFVIMSEMPLMTNDLLEKKENALRAHPPKKRLIEQLFWIK